MLVIDSDSSDEDVRPMKRRRDRTPFGAEASQAADDAASGTESVQFNNIMGSDEEMISQAEEGEDTDVESVRSRRRGPQEVAGDEVEVQREVDGGEDAAKAARREAKSRDDLETPSESGSEGEARKRRKRRRGGLVDDSEESEEDVDSVDRMVPFMVHGFCQGCKCKQNVYILGPIKRRRKVEADRVLVAMQERYRVSLVRGECRTFENNSQPCVA